jgi:probable F420-dependent oxidoreductase
MPLRFAYHYPDTTGTAGNMLDTGPIPDVARRAEAAGFHGLALTEHPAPGARWLDAGGHQSLDPFVAFGAAAAVTSRLRLITHLAVAPYRNPLLLGKAAATVDLMSDGRMTLGLGAGYLKTEFFALGVDFDERNTLFDEALEVLPMYWSGQPFDYQGQHFNARDVIARPQPIQKPIPIWIGGNSKKSLRRAAEHAQGWMPMFGPRELSATTRTRYIGSLAEMTDMVHELHSYAEAAHRPTSIDILCSYDDATIHQPKDDADRHREKLAELEQAGATWVVVSSNTHTPDETYRFLHEFGETYLV